MKNQKNLENIGEIYEAMSENDANDYLKDGWILLDIIHEEHKNLLNKQGIINRGYSPNKLTKPIYTTYFEKIYVLGKPKKDNE